MKISVYLQPFFSPSFFLMGGVSPFVFYTRLDRVLMGCVGDITCAF